MSPQMAAITRPNKLRRHTCVYTCVKAASGDVKKSTHGSFRSAEPFLPLCQTANKISDFSTTRHNRHAPPTQSNPVTDFVIGGDEAD